MQPQGSPSPAGLTGRQRHLAVLTILVGIAMTVLDSTTIALGLPTMTKDLGISSAQAIWIVNGFQLAALATLLPLANWGDRITYRRVYLAGAALWGLASAVASFADSMTVLILARVAQGLGAAGIMAVNMALVRLTWPPQLLGRGVALNSMVVGTATVAGPMLAAAVLSVGSWRWLFALNVPTCALLLVLGLRALPLNSASSEAPAPSVADMVLNAAMFILLFMAADAFSRSIRTTAEAGPGLLQGAALLVAGLAVATVHLRRQRRLPQPLLPVDLLRIPLFRLSMMTSVGGFAAQTVTFITLPFLLLDAWHVSASQAGLFMSCWPVATLVAAAVAGRLIGRLHNGTLGAAGMGALALGLAGLAWAALASEPGLAVAAFLALAGVGFGLFQSPNNHTIITSAPAQRSGAASGMLGTARLTGQSLGATLVALLFSIWGEHHTSALAAALAAGSVLALLAALASGLRVRHPPAA